jgi:hypothetical protein
LRRQFWIEVGLAVVSAALLLVTLLWSEWIEVVFKVDLDRSSGALEWAIVAALCLTTLACGALARSEWRMRVNPDGLTSGGL